MAVSSLKDLQSPEIINFDDLKTGTPVGNNYQALYGVVFDDGFASAALTAYADQRAMSLDNLAVNDPIKPNTSAGKPLYAHFDKPVSQVGMYIGGGDDATTAATLTAYDNANGVLCSVSYSPVLSGLSNFLGLVFSGGAQIHAVRLDYGSAFEIETIDDFAFSTYEPPVACPVSWTGHPSAMNAGASAGFSWTVNTNAWYNTQTYLVYDTVSHPAGDESYTSYQAPAPNSGTGSFSTVLTAGAAGHLYARPAVAYLETAGAPQKRCLGPLEIDVTINAASPTPSPAPGSVSGAVTTGKSAALNAASVQVCLGAACSSTASNKFGAYTIASLPPGEYVLTASLAGYDTFTSRVTVRSGQTTTANITLRLTPTPTPPPITGSISGQVRNQNTSTGIGGAAVQLRPGLGNASAYMADGTADGSGNFSFGSVPSGNWLVLASHADYFTWLQSYTVSAPAAAAGNVNLRPRPIPPTPVPSAALDLSVANVMAFQSSQRWNNSLPLAAGRATALRVFVNLGSLNPADLHAPVEAYLSSPGCLPDTGLFAGNVTPLPVSDWTTSNAERSAVLQNLNATLNFILPGNCTTAGTRHFVLRISTNTNNVERSLVNNTHEFDLTFNERRQLNVYVVRISLRENWLCPGSAQAAPPMSAVQPAMQALEWMFPTRVAILDGGTDDFCASPRQENYYPGWWYINLGLSIRFAGYAIPSSPGYFMGGAVPMAYGLVDGAECAGGTCAGGSTPMVLDHHWVSSGLSNRPTTAPHEVGHARGLLHAGNSHSESSGGSWVSWPYPHGAFSQFGASETWGWSFLDSNAYRPWGIVYSPIGATAPSDDTTYDHELMSYGTGPRWLSDVNYNNLFYSFRPPADAPVQDVAASPQRFLLVGGIQQQDGMIAVQAMRPLTDTTGALLAQFNAQTNPPTYTLQLKSITGTVLSSAGFMPAYVEGDKTPSFQFYLPYPDNVAAMTILTGTQVLTTHLYTSQAPLVTILSPSQSGIYTNTLTLSWTASDPDGETLEFDIAYSADGGQTWRGLASMLPGAVSTYTVNLNSLPGSENAFFRISASDGLNQSSAITAAPLVISRKAPTVTITSLSDGEHIPSQRLVLLEGEVMDAEDLPPFSGASFVWTSDRDGVIGVEQYATTYGLSAGWHTLTLTVTDSDGMTGTASVRVFIGSALYMPSMSR